jgi:DNA-binding MarR family transcriptional regulator
VARPSFRDEDYQRLLALRTGLRRFLHWSEEQAHAAGLTPSHHQLLLAVRGHDDPRGPTIGDIAGYLLLRHHSAVELAQRAEGLGLIDRVEDSADRRVVRLALTDKGMAALEQLTALHVEELARLADDLRPVWEGLEAIPSVLAGDRNPAPSSRAGPTGESGRAV